MLTVKSLNPDHRLAVTIAVFFSEDVLSTFEADFSNIREPRKAVEAAKGWLANPCEETAVIAYAAASSVASAFVTADAEAYYAVHAALSTARAAGYPSPFAIGFASNAVTSAAYACSYDNRILYTHKRLAQLLPHILEYKIYTKTSFKDPEQVFDLLSEENRQRFLFNLNHLR